MLWMCMSGGGGIITPQCVIHKQNSKLLMYTSMQRPSMMVQAFCNLVVSCEQQPLKLHDVIHFPLICSLFKFPKGHPPHAHTVIQHKWNIWCFYFYKLFGSRVLSCAPDPITAHSKKRGFPEKHIRDTTCYWTVLGPATQKPCIFIECDTHHKVIIHKCHGVIN